MTVFKNTTWHLGFFNSCTCTYLPLLAGVAANAMDMPPQFPTLPAESSDIFSLSDQVLSDRLEFIEEVGSIPFDVEGTIRHSS